MGLIDQMKYAKILSMANMLEDIQSDMSRDYHCRFYLDQIGGIVKGLRETIADTTLPNEMACERIEIKRLEHSHSESVLSVPRSEVEGYEECLRRHVEHQLLNYIADNKLIRVRRHMDNNGIVTFTASLIVGVEKLLYFPQEELPTFVDNLAKYLEETRE